MSNSNVWALPRGRMVSPIDFNSADWAPVTFGEAALIEEWGGDVVYLTMTCRQYWAHKDDARAARTVAGVCFDTEG